MKKTAILLLTVVASLALHGCAREKKTYTLWNGSCVFTNSFIQVEFYGEDEEGHEIFLYRKDLMEDFAVQAEAAELAAETGLITEEQVAEFGWRIADILLEHGYFEKAYQPIRANFLVEDYVEIEYWPEDVRLLPKGYEYLDDGPSFYLLVSQSTGRVFMPVETAPSKENPS